MNREPALTVGTVTAAVTAVLALLVAFGLDLTSEQQAAILGVVGVLAPIVATVITRTKVSPANTVVAQRTADGTVIAGEGAVVTAGIPVDVTVRR
ncbi:hypothetical protein QWY28_17430 [Nocardioides sp. SOB77]|uniref:Holin n=1 Tax=Nocardioides oceani TaxID=3058369 RepID=A0ABT8FKT8_9ACTN|nr:hypothetical protein [Nocardioides oceani]MDN4174747.1 hypothetical protein [Nocardioides oceani]